MTTRRLKSGATGLADGTTWADAFTTLVAAYAGSVAGDIILVSDAHAESTAGGVNMDSPGTLTSPVLVLCVDESEGENPTTLLATAVIENTADALMQITGRGFYIHGIKFIVGTGTGGGTSDIAINTGDFNPWSAVFEKCTFKIGSSNSNSLLRMGSGGTGASDAHLRFIDCHYEPTNAGQEILPSNVRWDWEGGSIINNLSLLMKPGQAHASIITLSGVDLSSLISGDFLVNQSGEGSNKVSFIGCKLGASVVAVTGTNPGPGGCITSLINSDDGDTNNRMEIHSYAGSIKADTATYLTAGAAFDSVNLSWKMESSANVKHQTPLFTPWMHGTIKTAGSKTFDIEILLETDGAPNPLKDNEIWIEVEYDSDVGSPLLGKVTDKVDILASGSDQSDGVGTGSWTISPGMTTPKSQILLTASVTVDDTGPFRARVALAKSSTTVFIDPKVTVT